MNRKLVFISACIFFVVGFSAENDEGRFDPSSLNKWTRELNEPFVVHNIEQSLKIKRIQDSLKVSGVAENSRRFIFQIQLVQTSDYASALTLESDKMILNASATLSLVAPPPTSRKFAGSAP